MLQIKLKYLVGNSDDEIEKWCRGIRDEEMYDIQLQTHNQLGNYVYKIWKLFNHKLMMMSIIIN